MERYCAQDARKITRRSPPALAPVEDWNVTAEDRVAPLDRKGLDRDDKGSAAIAACLRLRIDEAAAADKAAGGRQRDDDVDRLRVRRRDVAFDDRVERRDRAADAEAPFVVIARPIPDGRRELESPQSLG